MEDMILDIVKIFLPTILSFCIGISITPFLTSYLYKNEMWKKKAGKISTDGKQAEIFNRLHGHKEVGTPRLGGIIIWSSAFITIVGIWFISKIFPTEATLKLDFLSRDQTWIPLFALIAGSLIGLIDDVFEIKGNGSYFSGGLSLKKRVGIVFIIGLAVGFWFYFKLDISLIGIPFLYSNLEVGWLLVPIFALIMVFIYSGGVIDGIDGLAGGVFAIIFLAYSGIAFFQDQVNLSAFCAVIAGSILAFLWFNIPPARFYMSETGTMGLTVTLSIIALMTDSLGGGYGLAMLPIVAFPLVATTLSDIIQVTSKKLRNGKKVFLVAPIHHHFEALGWPSYKVTMRYWVISLVFAICGMIIALLG